MHEKVRRVHLVAAMYSACINTRKKNRCAGRGAFRIDIASFWRALDSNASAVHGVLRRRSIFSGARWALRLTGNARDGGVVCAWRVQGCTLWEVALFVAVQISTSTRGRSGSSSISLQWSAALRACLSVACSWRRAHCKEDLPKSSDHLLA